MLGEVELENLPLKKNALRHLGLPIEIKSGFIGKVKLQIPVRQIRSAPWIIIIERLYLVATPLPVQEVLICTNSCTKCNNLYHFYSGMQFWKI